ncbi:hypothetical protein EJ05DRAFT_505676 [Pseudovirgaria hyperparasitica]|uniref:Cell wall mannoprotein 1 n=1 Tax=Pseudovirgaria hyperparasitica TaxID=470096 RepID=A0A6A6VU75_9PEZI|nr:uncharacterized protein EJ05DRAFT_505676 [Pseudovirgaria hyperparasitica]KAF2752797.1 hypothetical protein EJ05DRAFT_505676 [Pseudovirgaria hyperparasitica]
MKFSAILFAGAAAAATMVERQGSGVDTVLAAISSISSATTALNNGITSFSGAGDAQTSYQSVQNSGDADSLEAASKAVIDAINTGNTNVGPIGQLELTDALQLQDPTKALGELVTQTVNNAISKKDAFTSAGVAGTVLEQLQQQQSAANTFSTTVVGKVPEAAQSIAQGLVQPITDALQKGVDAFQGSSNGPGQGSPSSSEGGSEPTAVPTGSAPVTTPAPTSAGPTPPSTPPPFTGAAMPTAAAGYGVAAAVALVAAAAL